MRSCRGILFTTFFTLLTALTANAQSQTPTNTTSPPISGVGHDYVKLLSETVSPANGSLSLRITVPEPPGRGLTYPFSFSYDSNGVHVLVGLPGGPGAGWGPNSWNPPSPVWSGGWSYNLPFFGYDLLSTPSFNPSDPKGTCWFDTGFTLRDTAAEIHPLGLVSASGVACVDTVNSVTHGGDGRVQGEGSSTVPLSAADGSGTVYKFGPSCNGTGGNGISYCLVTGIEDRNGNEITIQTSNPDTGPFSVTDSAGRTLVSGSGFGTSGNTVTVSGLPQPFTLTWGSASSSFTPSLESVQSGNVDCITKYPESATQSVVTAITLPNNKQYLFSYDPTYGYVDKITYPTGGYVSYAWGFNPLGGEAVFEGGLKSTCVYAYDLPAVLHRYVSFDGVNIALQQDFSYSTTWNTNAAAWISKQTTVTTHDLVRGTTFQTTYLYNYVLSPDVPYMESFSDRQIPVEQTVSYYGTNGSLLKTVTKAWIDQYQLGCELVTLDNGQISGTFYSYGAGDQVTDKKEYDYGLITSVSACQGSGSTVSAPPSGVTPTRETVYNYQSFPHTPIFTLEPSIFDRPSSVITYGNGTRLAETDFTYDQSQSSCSGDSTCAVSPAPTSHDETNYAASSTAPRGNATTATKQCFQGTQACASGNLTTTSAFDETGQVLSTTDPNNRTTQFSYADSYTVLSNGANVAYTPTGNTNTYLTRITNPLSQTQNFTYDFNTGQLTVAKDQNSLVTTYLYNDSLARPTLTTRSDGGTTAAAYNDSALTVTTSKQINTSQTITTVSVSDGLGHPKESQLTSDPQGTVYTDTAYDGLGRAYTVSNPYRSGSDPSTSSGTTTFYYDTLGRKCLEVPPDGTQPSGGVCPTSQPANTIFTTYSGNTTTVTDQTGKSRKSVADALGRMTQLFEDPAGLSYETDYSYDGLGNLLCVGQKGTNSGTFTNCSSIPAGWHPRNFSYDSLSRLLTSTNPETGTITYKYDSDSNCTSPSTFLGLLVSKTDARGIRTCAQYDAINRQTIRNYSNGDPTVTTTYDQANCLGLSTCQNIGYRTSGTDAAGSESWAYQVDVTNHRSVHANQRTTNSITKPSLYYFDLAGNVTQAVYPTGRVVNYTFDNAARPSTASDGSNGIIYASDFETAPPGCLAGAVCYTPQGTFYALSIGQTSSFTGLNLTHTYNSRLQPNEFKASSTGGNAIDITYNFIDPVTVHNAGHVYSITNNLDSTRSQTFTYDQLNRITSALTTSTYSTSPAHCWGETYALDPWANLNSIAATTNSAYNGCSVESGFSATADGNNHLPVWGYDASGNTQTDGTISYTWDAESQLGSATNAGLTTNYTYDGDGRRVSKVGSKLYWYGSGGDILAETDTNGNTNAEYIFFGGKRIAMLSKSIPNAGFEQGLTGWTTSGTAQLINDPTRAHSGNDYVQLSAAPNTRSDVVSPYIPVSPGDQITFGGWGYLESGSGCCTRWILSLFDSNYSYVDNATGSVSDLTSASWTYSVGTYTVPANVAYAQLDAQIYLPTTASVARFDDAFITTTPLYYVEDMLGTSRVIAQNNGVVCYDADFYPYGGERSYTNTCPQNYKFEGKERDTETGNDDFGARYYSNRFGRWLSADWSSVPIPVPYANLTNPQTLNLYSMVADDPESFADLDGHAIGCDPNKDKSCNAHEPDTKKDQPNTVCNSTGTTCTTTTKQTEIMGNGGDTLLLHDKTTVTTTTKDENGNVTATYTTQTDTVATFSSETGKFQDATQSSYTTIKYANGQEAGGYNDMMRPISKEAAQAAIGQAAWDQAQAAATPGAFKSYLVAHKSGLHGLLGDIVLAGTPAPEVRWLAKVKEVVEGLLFVHTVHELVP